MIEVKTFHRAIAEAVGLKSGLNFEALNLAKINLRTLKVSDNGRVSPRVKLSTTFPGLTS